MGTAKICGAAYSTFSSRLWSTGDKNGFNEAEIPNQSYGFIRDSFIVLSLHAAACVAACQRSDFIHSDQVKVMLDGMFHTRGSHRVFYGILRGVPGDQSVDQPPPKLSPPPTRSTIWINIIQTLPPTVLTEKLGQDAVLW